MSDKRQGRVSRRQFMAAACAPIVAVSVGCGDGSTITTTQVYDAGNVCIQVGTVVMRVPFPAAKIVGLVIVLVGGSLKLYVVFNGGERAEVKTSIEELQAVQEAESKGKKAEVQVNGVVNKAVEISEEKK